MNGNYKFKIIISIALLSIIATIIPIINNINMIQQKFQFILFYPIFIIVFSMYATEMITIDTISHIDNMKYINKPYGYYFIQIIIVLSIFIGFLQISLLNGMFVFTALNFLNLGNIITINRFLIGNNYIYTQGELISKIDIIKIEEYKKGLRIIYNKNSKETSLMIHRLNSKIFNMIKDDIYE